MDMQGQNRDMQGQNRDKQGQKRDNKKQALDCARVDPVLSLPVSILIIQVHVCPCFVHVCPSFVCVWSFFEHQALGPCIALCEHTPESTELLKPTQGLRFYFKLSRLGSAGRQIGNRNWARAQFDMEYRI